MRTYTIEKTAYKFEELSENAKDNFRYSIGFFSSDDYLKTIRKGVEYLSFKLVNYSIDWDCFNGCYIKVSCEFYELNSEEIEHINNYINELKAKIDDYPLTGFCADYNFIKALRNIESLEDYELMVKNACLEIIKDGCNYYQELLTDEAIIDHCEFNNYEFEENGELI